MIKRSLVPAVPGPCRCMQGLVCVKQWRARPGHSTASISTAILAASVSTTGRAVSCRACAADDGTAAKPAQRRQAAVEQRDADEAEWDEDEVELDEFDEFQEYEEGAEWEEGGEFDEDEEYEGEQEAEEGESSSRGDQAGTSSSGSRARRIPEDATVAEYTEGDFVEVGLITKAFGIRGEVKVQPITDEPKRRFGKAGRRLWLEAPTPKGLLAPSQQGNKQLKRVLVEKGRMVKPAGNGERELWAVKFKEVADRTQAETLAQHKLLLAVCDREPIPRSTAEHVYYVQDLVGLRAFLAATGQLLGEVTEVHDGTGTYDTLRIRLVPNAKDIERSQYRTVLVPFAKEIVPVVDVGAARLEVDPPEGLLELASARKLRRPYSEQQQRQMLAQLAELEGQRAAQQHQGAPDAAAADAGSDARRGAGVASGSGADAAAGVSESRQAGAAGKAAPGAVPAEGKPMNRAARRAAARAAAGADNSADG